MRLCSADALFSVAGGRGGSGGASILNDWSPCGSIEAQPASARDAATAAASTHAPFAGRRAIARGKQAISAKSFIARRRPVSTPRGRIGPGFVSFLCDRFDLIRIGDLDLRPEPHVQKAAHAYHA